MKPLLIVLLTLMSSLSFAQVYSYEFKEYTDYLLDKDDTKIYCNILQIKNGKVKFKLEDKIYLKTEDITNFNDVKFSGVDVLKNTLEIEVEKPNENYSNIYFYAANDLPYTVMENKKKVVRISKYSYYLHKVEANKTYELYCSVNTRERDKLIIEAKGGKTYIVKGISDKLKGRNIYNRMRALLLVIDTSKLSEYALLSMSKKARKYHSSYEPKKEEQKEKEKKEEKEEEKKKESRW